MIRRALVSLCVALAVLLSAECPAMAPPDLVELRKEYPLYQDQPTVDGVRVSLRDMLDKVPIGVLATIEAGPEIVRLRNENADGSKAIATLQPIAVEYERYVLLVDTVIFGENPGGEIALYLPKTSYIPAQDVDRRVGNRFYFNLSRYEQPRQQQLQTLLQCNGVRERFPIFLGGAAVYWTRQGVMLSAFPGPTDDQFDGMSKEQFIRTISELTRKRDAVQTLRMEYPKHSDIFFGAIAPLGDYIGRANYGVLATVAADPQPLRLGTDRYVHYTLRIDSVVFGALEARTVDLYLTQAQADGIVAQPLGSSFFYPLFELSAAEKDNLAARLQAAGIAQQNPILSGGPMFYRTRYGTLLSVAGEGGQTKYDLLPQAQFVRAMRELRGQYKWNQ